MGVCMCVRVSTVYIYISCIEDKDTPRVERIVRIDYDLKHTCSFSCATPITVPLATSVSKTTNENTNCIHANIVNKYI